METELKSKINFILNDSETEISVNPSTTLLDVLRKDLHLTGTKEGCREGDCGACTILLGALENNSVSYISANSCLLPVTAIAGKHVVTIEGLNSRELTLIQKCFIEEGASQCGFCTPGFIISLTGYFLSGQAIKKNNIIESLDGNICRCTGHQSIINSSLKIQENISNKLSTTENRVTELVSFNVIPEYFSTIPKRLKELTINDIQKNNKSVYKISGGTDLYVKNWEDIYRNGSAFLSSDDISSTLEEQDGKIIIGAKATISDFIESSIIKNYFQKLPEKLKLFGSLPIRNRATIGGNIVNASPIADMVNILLALDAMLTLQQEGKTREVRLKNFYKGYKTFDLKENELINSISFNVPEGNYFFNYEKVSKRTYLDIASVNTSIYLEIKNNFINKVQLSAGGVAPIPLFLSKTASYLTNKALSANALKEATDIALKEISPISDARGSDVYKSLLLKQLIYAHFITLFPDQITIKDVA